METLLLGDALKLIEAHRNEFLYECRVTHGMSPARAWECLQDFEAEHLNAAPERDAEASNIGTAS